jgi:hypothetical protein
MKELEMVGKVWTQNIILCVLHYKVKKKKKRRKEYGNIVKKGGSTFIKIRNK